MIKMIKMYHNPVLLKESIIGLNINPNGIYVDATFGGGGHSTEILNNLNSSGRLIAFDQDQDAIENKILDKRVSLVKSNFKYLNNYLNYFRINKIDGLLADFGISSYQIELCHNIKPHIAILLNISPDHIDRHGTFMNYVDIKFDLFSHQDENDFAILGLDGGIISNTIDSKQIRAKKICFVNQYYSKYHYKNDNSKTEKTLYIEKNGRNIQYSLELIGSMNRTINIENISASVACMETLGFHYSEYLSYFQTFKSLKHRSEYIGTHNNIDFINDSKATNAFASKIAIQSFTNVFWILGGIKKYGGIDEIKDSFQNIEKAYLIGQAADSFRDCLMSCGIENEVCGTLDIALNSAFRDANYMPTKATVLFSPACASFDQFANFEERGNKFCELVNNIKSNKYENY